MINGIGHVGHDDLVTAYLSSHCLQKFSDQHVQLSLFFEEEIEGSVPSYPIEFFLPHYPLYQCHCSLEFAVVAANLLEERDITAFYVYSRDELNLCLFNGFRVILIVIVLILEDRLSVLSYFERVPARTYIVKFVRVFESVFKTLFIPRCQKYQFLERGIELLRGVLLILLLKDNRKIRPL